MEEDSADEEQTPSIDLELLSETSEEEKGRRSSLEVATEESKRISSPPEVRPSRRRCQITVKATTTMESTDKIGGSKTRDSQAEFFFTFVEIYNFFEIHYS